MAVLKDRADLDGELIVAVVALEQTRPVRLTVQAHDVFRGTAVRADRAVRSQNALDGLACLIFGKG
jgi:hypothetical protein